MQKYFIFTISAEVFRKLTDVNTQTFWEFPFAPTEDLHAKKREKRTSVIYELQSHSHPHPQSQSQSNRARQRTNESLGVSAPRGKLMRECSINNQSDYNSEEFRSRAKEREKDLRKIFHSQKMHKTVDSLHLELMKSIQVLPLKKEVVAHVKHRFVRHASFKWREHCLQLAVRAITPGQPDLVFEGRELAVKNVHERPMQPKLCSATELILIKYQESNLTNLSCYTHEGLGKISLEHIYLVNNSSLYSRYHNEVSMAVLPNEPKVNSYYRANNCFFETARPAHRVPKLKTTLSKVTSLREDQRRFKYVEILHFARDCLLPFDYVGRKRRKCRNKSFMVVNRLAGLDHMESMLHMRFERQSIVVAAIGGEVLLSFSLDKLQNYFPYIWQLSRQQQKSLMLSRILVDEDLIRLCASD
jgi:hypothetical protein